MLGYIGLGSNLGDRTGHLQAALQRMAARGLAPVELSSVWSTTPLDGGGPGRFLNMVAAVETPADARRVLDTLLDIERELGRVRATRNAPRTIDLDLLTLGDLALDEPGLKLPHPRMWERRFVLAPLAEIAPALRDPATGRTAAHQERLLRPAQPGVIRAGTLDLPRAQLL